MSIADGSEQVVDLPPLSPYADLDEIRLHLIRMQQWLRAREPIAAGSVLTKFVTNGALVSRGLLEFSGEIEGAGNAGFAPEGDLTAAAGIAGADAPIVVLTSTGQIFIKPANGGTITPASVTLTATTANVPGQTYQWLVDGVVDGAATSSTYAVTSFAPGPAKLIRVNVTGSNGVSVFDTMSVYSLQEGSDAIGAGLDNENQTIQCDSAGTPVAGSFPVVSKMVVARGATFLAAPDVIFSVVESTGIESAGTTLGASANVAIDAAGNISIGKITSGYAEAIFRATVGSATLDKKLTLNKSVNGATGSDAQTLVLSATGFAFVFADEHATTSDSPTLTFTAALQNVTGSATFSATAYDNAGASLGSVPLTDASGMTLDLDLTTPVVDPRVVVTRANATATYVDSAGVMQVAAANAPRIDYDPVTLACKGLLVEEARTNAIRNSVCQGAAVGSPGTPPTNWTAWTGVTQGLTYSIAGTGTEDGLSYIDVAVTGTFSGTPGATSLTPAFEAWNAIATVVGETWTQSAYLKLVSGSLSGVEVTLRQHEYNVGGAAVTSGTSAAVSVTTAPLRTQRAVFTRTMADATVAYTLPRLRFVYSANAAYTFVLRVAAPQLEKASSASSYIPTSTAAVTRAADVCTLSGADFSSWYNQTEGTFVAEASAPYQINNAAYYPAIVTAQDASGNDRMGLGGTWISSQSRYYFGVTDDSVSQASVGSSDSTLHEVDGAVFRRAAAYKINDFALSGDGAAALTDTAGTVPTVDRLSIGHRTGASQLNGHIRRLSYYNTRRSNAELQVLSAGGSISNSRTLSAAQFNSRGSPATRTVKVTATLGSLSDSMTVYRGDNGSSAVQAALSNEVHTLPAAADGTVSSYAGSGTEIRVFEGVTELDYDGVGTANGKWTVTRAVATGTVSSPGAISESALKAVVADHAGMTTDVATITYTITGKTATGASFSFPKVQTLTKSKQGVTGATGATGSNAQYVVVTGDQAFKYLPNATTPTSTTITLSAQLTGGLTTYDWEYWTGSAWANLGGTQTAQTYAIAHNAAEWGSATALRIRCTSGAYSDEITIVKLYDGSSTVQTVLSNEAHTLATTADGVVTYTGSGTLIRTFEGTTELQFVASAPGNGQWTVTAAPTNIGVGGGTITGLYVTVGDHNSMTADQAKIDYTVTGKTSTGASFAHLVTQSFSKSKAGAAGSSITAQSNAGNVFRLNASGTGFTPSSIIVSRVLGDGVTDPSAAGTVWTVVSGTTTNSLAVLNTTTGAPASFEPSEMTSDTLTLRCTVTDSVTGRVYTDDITLFKVRDSISGYLTNDSISLPAAAGGGAVSSYTGATGTFKVVGDSGDITVTGGNPAFSYVSSTGFSPAPTGSINSSGVYTISSGIDPSTAVQVATVTYRATYVDPLGGSTKTIDRMFTITKAAAGATGATGPAGSTGSTGQTGTSSRIAYALWNASTGVPSVSGTPSPTTGSASLPSTAGLTPAPVTSFTSTVQNPAAGQAMCQCDGLYDAGTNQVTWSTPYLSNLRVGSLSALVTISGEIMTAASGARIVLNESTSNTLRGYTSTGLLTFEADADNGRTRITGNSAIFGALFVTQQSSAAAIEGSGNSGPGVWGYSTSGPGGRFSSLRIDQTPATGAATATFVSTNKPGAGSSNGWITINMNGTPYYVPAWT